MNYYEQVAAGMGIATPVNGSWIQAICEQLGVTETLNGSWEQALTQYYVSGGGTLENTINNITQEYGDICYGCGPKGADLITFILHFNSGLSNTGGNGVGKILTVSNWYKFITSSNDGLVNTDFYNTYCFNAIGDSSNFTASFTMVATDFINTVFRFNVVDQNSDPPLVSETILYTPILPT